MGKKKLKDVKPYTPNYPDTCSNSCSNSFISSSGSYPCAPAELPKVPAPLQTLPPRPSHSRLWIPKDKASSMWLLAMSWWVIILWTLDLSLFLSVSVTLTQTFPKQLGYRGQTSFFPGMSEQYNYRELSKWVCVVHWRLTQLYIYLVLCIWTV